MRLRMVDLYQHDERYFLRHTSLCLTLTSQAKELQQQDRCMERGNINIRVVVWQGSFLNSDRAWLHQNCKIFLTQV